MVSTENSIPTCPVCHQPDLVKTTQAAYSSGVARCAPPAMPTQHIPMLPYIGAGVVLIGILMFLVIVLVASGGMGAVHRSRDYRPSFAGDARAKNT